MFQPGKQRHVTLKHILAAARRHVGKVNNSTVLMEAVLTHGACALQLGGTLTPQALRQERCSRSTSLFVNLRVETKRFLISGFLSPDIVSNLPFSVRCYGKFIKNLLFCPHFLPSCCSAKGVYQRGSDQSGNDPSCSPSAALDGCCCGFSLPQPLVVFLSDRCLPD